MTPLEQDRLAEHVRQLADLDARARARRSPGAAARCSRRPPAPIETGRSSSSRSLERASWSRLSASRRMRAIPRPSVSRSRRESACSGPRRRSETIDAYASAITSGSTSSCAATAAKASRSAFSRSSWRDAGRRAGRARAGARRPGHVPAGPCPWGPSNIDCCTGIRSEGIIALRSTSNGPSPGSIRPCGLGRGTPRGRSDARLSVGRTLSEPVLAEVNRSVDQWRTHCREELRERPGPGARKTVRSRLGWRRDGGRPRARHPARRGHARARGRRARAHRGRCASTSCTPGSTAARDGRRRARRRRARRARRAARRGAGQPRRAVGARDGGGRAGARRAAAARPS